MCALSVDGRAAHQLKNMTVPEMYRSLKDRIDKSHEELMRRIEVLRAPCFASPIHCFPRFSGRVGTWAIRTFLNQATFRVSIHIYDRVSIHMYDRYRVISL